MFIQAQYCSLAKSYFLAFVSYITNQASFRSAPNNVLSYGKSAIGIMSVGRIETYYFPLVLTKDNQISCFCFEILCCWFCISNGHICIINSCYDLACGLIFFCSAFQRCRRCITSNFGINNTLEKWFLWDLCRKVVQHAILCCVILTVTYTDL